MKYIWYLLIIYIYNWKTYFLQLYHMLDLRMTWRTRGAYIKLYYDDIYFLFFTHMHLDEDQKMHKDTKCISMLLQERSFLFLTCWPYQISLQGLLLASSWAKLRCCDSPPGSGTLHDVRRDPTGASHADVNAVPSVKRDEDYRDDGHVIHMKQF